MDSNAFISKLFHPIFLASIEVHQSSINRYLKEEKALRSLHDRIDNTNPFEKCTAIIIIMEGENVKEQRIWSQVEIRGSRFGP